MRKNTTDNQVAAFVASIGNPWILQLCNSFGDKLQAGEYKYEEVFARMIRKEIEYENSPWFVGHNKKF